MTVVSPQLSATSSTPYRRGVYYGTAPARDHEIVAAIAPSDMTGVAAAFDRYAQELHSYCQSRLSVPADAAGAVQDTFIIASSEVSGMSQPDRLRVWLFAVARNECHRRLRAAGRRPPRPEAARAMDDTVQLAALTEQAKFDAAVAGTLAGLDPVAREIGELNLRHGLYGADLGAVLGVSSRQAQALASRVRAQVERLLSVAPVASSMHEVRPEMLLSMLTVPELPVALRQRTLRLLADPSPDAVAYRAQVAARAAPFGTDGFPIQLRRPSVPRWRGTPVMAAVAAAAGLALLGSGMYYLNYTPASGSSPTPSASATAPESSRSARLSARPSHRAPTRYATTPLLALPTHSPTHLPSPTRPTAPTPTHSLTPTPTPTHVAHADADADADADALAHADADADADALAHADADWTCADADWTCADADWTCADAVHGLRRPAVFGQTSRKPIILLAVFREMRSIA